MKNNNAFLYTLKITDTDILAFSSNTLSLDSILSTVGFNQKFVVCITNGSTAKNVFLNLTLMLREPNSTSGSLTWIEFITKITDIDILTYTVQTFTPITMLDNQNGKLLYVPLPFSSIIQKTPEIISVENSQSITCGYSITSNPTVKNNPNLKYMLTDIFFSQTADEISFENTIPIINGVVGYPMVFDNELWAKDTTRYLTTTANRNLNLLLVDFSNVGGMTTIRFSDCKNTVTKNRISAVMPKDIGDATPIVVIAGRMFFSKDYNMPNTSTIEVDLDNIGLEKILMSNDIILSDFEYNSNIVSSKTIEEYGKSISDPVNFENYIILVKNSHLRPMFYSSHGKINVNDILFPKDLGGLLVQETTKEIIDYLRLIYPDKTRAIMDLPYLGNNILNSSETPIPSTGFLKTSYKILDDLENNYLDVAYRNFNEVYDNFNNYQISLMVIYGASPNIITPVIVGGLNEQ